MIYIASNTNINVYKYANRHGIAKERIRAITRSEQLTGLTGGNIYALPTFKLNDEAIEILENANDRFIRVINISESCSKEELFKMEKQS